MARTVYHRFIEAYRAATGANGCEARAVWQAASDSVKEQFKQSGSLKGFPQVKCPGQGRKKSKKGQQQKKQTKTTKTPQKVSSSIGSSSANDDCRRLRKSKCIDNNDCVWTVGAKPGCGAVLQARSKISARASGSKTAAPRAKPVVKAAGRRLYKVRKAQCVAPLGQWVTGKGCYSLGDDDDDGEKKSVHFEQRQREAADASNVRKRVFEEHSAPPVVFLPPPPAPIGVFKNALDVLSDNRDFLKAMQLATLSDSERAKKFVEDMRQRYPQITDTIVNKIKTWAHDGSAIDDSRNLSFINRQLEAVGLKPIPIEQMKREVSNELEQHFCAKVKHGEAVQRVTKQPHGSYLVRKSTVVPNLYRLYLSTPESSAEMEKVELLPIYWSAQYFPALEVKFVDGRYHFKDENERKASYDTFQQGLDNWYPQLKGKFRRVRC